jgi:4-hydroxy-tetrahydrodipicolinate synthase
MKEFIGTGVALITPFKADYSIDFNALSNIVEHQISNGTDYLVVLGTTGESATLSKEEKRAVMDCIIEANNSRVPLVLGIGGNNTIAVAEEFQNTNLEGFSAILSVSPYYNKPSQQGLIAHYTEISKHSPLPIVLYNVPGRTGRNMSAATTVELAKTCSNIIAIKEASGDMQQCMDILRWAPESFMVVSGDDNLVIPQIACGMQGVISVAANAYPKHFSNMVNACLQGDFSAAKLLNDKLMDAYNLMFEENNPAGIKCFLQAMGKMKDTVRLPVTTVSDSLNMRINTWVNNNQL